MRIRVDWKDSLFGTRGDPNDCGVARAIRRQVPYAIAADVDMDDIFVYRAGLAPFAVSPSSEVRSKIYSFDRWHFMWPFSFELVLDSPSPATVVKTLDEQLREELVAV